MGPDGSSPAADPPAADSLDALFGLQPADPVPAAPVPADPVPAGPPDRELPDRELPDREPLDLRGDDP